MPEPTTNQPEAALALIQTKSNQTTTHKIQVMLIPPREYVERWLVKPSRPYYR